MAMRKMELRQWVKACALDLVNVGKPSELWGPNRRRAAKALGITVGGVHAAVTLGRLDELRVFDSGTLRLVVIPEASIARYRAEFSRKAPLLTRAHG